MKYKFWVRRARYDQADTSDFANQSFSVELRDPKGARLSTKTMTADAYGGLDGEFPLASASTPGVYQLQIANLGGGSFRVEENTQPEFEVSIEPPIQPVRLGDKIRAMIRARHEDGSPVAKAKVEYKVLRWRYARTWYPPDAWDWLYGRGYWWFGYDRPWLPGWRGWGWPRRAALWRPQREEPPEVVADRETEIGQDGTVAVDIDTALAKAVHPDDDQQYQIIAQVVDSKRRRIVASGNVLVARKPFQVYACVDRGYYHVGDVIRAEFHAQKLAGTPVRGDGKLSLFKIVPHDGQVVETLVRSWNQETDEHGEATLQLKASEAGRYRFSYQLTNDTKETQEGGYVFTILGDEPGDSDLRFNPLELVPDRRAYAPQQTVKLLLNSNRADSTVLLFLHRRAAFIRTRPCRSCSQANRGLLMFKSRRRIFPTFSSKR